MYNIVMLVALVMYRHSVHRATTGIALLSSKGTTTLKNQEHTVTLEDEVIAEHLLQDLAPSQRVPCGKEKCFYRSKSNADFGYLVARCSRDYSKTDRFERLVSGWNLAQELERTYNMKHFLKGPPEAITVSQDLSTFFNRNLWFESHEEKLRGSKAKRFPVGSHAYVQKVKVAPTPNLLLAVAPSNQIQFDNSVEEFLLNATPSFARRLHKNLVQTRTLLQKEPCLIKDFQVLMDQRGELYHLDFDRCFQPREVDETEECFQYLDNVESQILGILTQIQTGNITLASVQAKKATLENMQTDSNITLAMKTKRGNRSSEDDMKEIVDMKTVSSQFDSFVPENLAESERVPCGKEKCFFQTKSDPKVAYLVARSSEKENRKERFKSLEEGWQLAEQLRREHHIQHFLLGPPVNVTVSKELASRLNQNLFSEKLQRMDKSDTERFPEGSTAFVQKVETAPEPNIIVGCVESKQDAFKIEFDAFLSSVKNKESFVRKFKENFTKARQLLFVEPCLLKDFQVLVDSKGNVYQLDFDRCFSPESAEKKYTAPNDLIEAPCIQALDEIEKTIYLSVVSSQAQT